MVGSIIVIIFGLGFGGLLDELGVLEVLLSKFEKFLSIQETLRLLLFSLDY